MNKNIKCFLQVTPQMRCASVALLLVRLVMGVAFMCHGWGKIQNPMAWIPEQASIQVPGIFQALAAVAEFGGGLALVLGLLTSFASVGLMATMLVATVLHAFILKDPFVNPTGGAGYELALLYFVLSFMFLVLGPGQFSIDKKLFGDRICTK